MKTEIEELDFKERQYVVRQLVDTVVTDGATASVEGSIPLVIPEENTNNNYEQSFINRYGLNTTPLILPFELNIPLPPPHKTRRILERDKLGRIIYTQP